jgi:hypothetical protein
MVMVVKLKMFCPATCGTAVNFVGSKITTLPGVTLEKSRGPSAPVEPLLNWAEALSVSDSMAPKSMSHVFTLLLVFKSWTDMLTPLLFI